MKPSVVVPVPAIELLNTQQAAEYLHLSPATLEVWRTTGRYSLPFLKLGRTVKYRRIDLDEWVQSREMTSTGGQQAA